MATATTRLALTKPAGGENKQVTIVNANYDKIDASVGVQWVADGALPASQFIGAVYQELTSGRRYVLKDNGLGGFTPIPQEVFGVFRATLAVVSGVQYGMGPTITADADNIGLTGSNVALSADNIRINLPGVYSFDWFVDTAAAVNAASKISIGISQNGAAYAEYVRTYVPIGGTGGFAFCKFRVQSGQYASISPSIIFTWATTPVATNFTASIARIG